MGWAYGKNITAELATKAVKNACLNIPDTTGIVLHSDLGSQYTSEEFEKYLQERGMIHSFSRKGNPYDNACIESFHSVFKEHRSKIDIINNIGLNYLFIFPPATTCINFYRKEQAAAILLNEQPQPELFQYSSCTFTTN